jgi:hypothetical protein
MGMAHLAYYRAEQAGVMKQIRTKKIYSSTSIAGIRFAPHTVRHIVNGMCRHDYRPGPSGVL